MESQPQNPEFRINPENFHLWVNEPAHEILIVLTYVQKSPVNTHSDITSRPGFYFLIQVFIYIHT